MIQALIPYGFYPVTLVVEVLGEETYTVSWLTTKAGVPHLLKHQQVEQTTALQHILAKHPALPILLCLSQDAAVVMPTGEVDDHPLQAAMGVVIKDSRPFFWQVLPTTDGRSWTSVMRKSQLEDVQSALGPAWQQVQYINAHPGTLAYLIPLLPMYQAHNPYCLPVQEIEFGWKNGLQSEIPTPAERLRVEDLAEALPLTETQLWPMATFVHAQLSAAKDLHGWQPEFDQHARYVQRIQRWGKVLGGAAGVLGVWLLLLGMVQTRLGHRITQGQQYLLQEQATLTRLTQQQSVLQHYQQTSQQQPQEILGQSKVSYYLDQIAKQLGGKVSLTDLYVHPAAKLLKKQGIDPEVPPDILCLGATKSAFGLGASLARLKALPFIEQVDLTHSTFDFEAQCHRFSLIIHLVTP